MTLSKRNSRKIQVSGKDYLWSPSRNSGFMVLVVQLATGRGKKLEVVISDDQNIIVENGSFSIPYSFDTNADILVITPALVQQVILDSIQLGWNPEDSGPPAQLTLNDAGILEIRRGLD